MKIAEWSVQRNIAYGVVGGCGQTVDDQFQCAGPVQVRVDLGGYSRRDIVNYQRCGPLEHGPAPGRIEMPREHHRATLDRAGQPVDGSELEFARPSLLRPWERCRCHVEHEAGECNSRLTR